MAILSYVGVGIPASDLSSTIPTGTAFRVSIEVTLNNYAWTEALFMAAEGHAERLGEEPRSPGTITIQGRTIPRVLTPANRDCAEVSIRYQSFFSATLFVMPRSLNGQPTTISIYQRNDSARATSYTSPIFDDTGISLANFDGCGYPGSQCCQAMSHCKSIPYIEGRELPQFPVPSIPLPGLKIAAQTLHLPLDKGLVC